MTNEIYNNIKKLIEIEYNVSNLVLEIFNSLVKLAKTPDDLNELREIYSDKLKTNESMQKLYGDKKVQLLDKIVKTEIKETDVIPKDESNTKELILNTNDYSELQQLFKKNLSEIKSNETLMTMYEYKKDELLYNKAKETLLNCSEYELEDKWIKIYSSIKNNDYLDDLQKTYKSRTKNN